MRGPNPFCSRFVRPGALEYLFPDGWSAARLAARLAENGWRGQIVGRPGTGKSTLVATLIPALRAAGRRPVVATVRDGPRGLPRGIALRLRACLKKGLAAVVVLDGDEQLTRFGRFRLRRLARDYGAGLLVTSHVDAGLPHLWRSEVTPSVARGVLERLLAHTRVWWVSVADLQERLAVRAGDLRQALFDLYDLHQQREL